MRLWLYMLGGLLIWAFHFAGIYLVVSLAAQTLRSDDAMWRGASLAISLVCAAATAVLLRVATRRARTAPQGLRDQLAACGALMALVAILWQAAAPLA